MKTTLFWGYVVVAGVLVMMATISALLESRDDGDQPPLSELGTLAALWLTYLVISLSGVPQ